MRPVAGAAAAEPLARPSEVPGAAPSPALGAAATRLPQLPPPSPPLPPGDAAVGARVEVFWDGGPGREGRWVRATVESYDERSGRHWVAYDGGVAEPEALSMRNVARAGHLRALLSEDDEMQNADDGAAAAMDLDDVTQAAASPTAMNVVYSVGPPDTAVAEAEAEARCPSHLAGLARTTWVALACAGGTSARATAAEVVAFVRAAGCAAMLPQQDLEAAGVVAALVSAAPDQFTRTAPGRFALTPALPVAPAPPMPQFQPPPQPERVQPQQPLQSLPAGDAAAASRHYGPFRAHSTRHHIWAALLAAGERGLRLEGIQAALSELGDTSCAASIRHCLVSDASGAFVCIADGAFALAEAREPGWSPPALLRQAPSEALTAGAGPWPPRRFAEEAQPAHAAAGCAREQPFAGHGAFRTPGQSPNVLVGPRLPAHPVGPASPQRKYRLGRSSVHEWGLFATAPIAEGERIIEYTGELIPIAMGDVREKEYAAQRLDNYLFRVDKRWTIDATRAGNGARYINHSCAPNCESRVQRSGVAGKAGRIFIDALRDIRPGEELTYDYKFEEEPPEKKIPCRCGAATCRGFMN